MASASEPAPKPAGDWKFLQKRVFARWLNNKLLVRQKNEHEAVKLVKITEENILTCWNSGHQLVALIEVLSKKDCPYKSKLRTEFKNKIQQIENINIALKWCWDAGVQLELKPSAENLEAGDERNVMGLIWGIMRSFLNFGFDDERLSVADALLKWVRGQISPYPQLSVNNFTTHWHNGLIFCALIHRYRPDLIGDFNALDRAEGEKNLTLALGAAEKWFGLDQYISPADIPILDDKSMIIYVSEWYAGITSFGKAIMAAQRIANVIDFTLQNDKLKEEYTQRARAWRAKVEPLVKQLDEPLSPHDSIESIRQKIDAFEAYQTKEKPALLSEHLDLESLLSYLQIRLADSAHPQWVPESGIRMADLRALSDQLDSVEARRNAALRTELNRQLTLLALSGDHESLYNQIKAYLASKRAQVDSKQEINSVAIGAFQHNNLQTLLSEVDAISSGDVLELKKIGEKLLLANFSGINVVHQRETAVDEAIAGVKSAAAAKADFLQDTINVLSFKDNLELQVSAYNAKADALHAWCDTHKGNLKALVDALSANVSIPAAKRAIYSLKVLNADRSEKTRTELAALRKAGDEIAQAKLDSQFHGPISYANPVIIKAREEDLLHEFTALDEFSLHKADALDKILEAEKQKDQQKLNYANLAAGFVRFVESAVERANSQKSWGATVAELEANAPSDAVLHEANGKMDAALQAYNAQSQSTEPNPYTALSLADLQGTQSKLLSALDARKSRYDAELATVRERDATFKAFAEIAVPFLKSLHAAKEHITNSVAPLDQQLADVDHRLSTVDSSPELATVSGFAGRLGGGYNPYTQVTVDECQVTHAQFKAFLNSKKKALLEQIEASKNRGITPAQQAEWQKTFAEYDKDHSGWLSPDEFKQMLFALGEKRKPEEVAKLIEEYGDGPQKKINFDGFKRFMIKLHGQSLSKEEISNSFDLINRNESFLPLDAPHIQTALPKNAREYLLNKAPKNAKGEVDIKAFIDDIFSR